MRILTIINWYPPHHAGGYEIACNDVTTRLARRGHEVRVLCCDDHVVDASPPDPDHELLVHRELRCYFRDGAPWKPPLVERLRIERRNHQVLARHLAEFRPDVVAVWAMGTMSLGLLRHVREAGVPMAYFLCDDWLTYGEKLDAWSALFVGNPLKRLVGRVVEPIVRVPTTCGDIGAFGAFCFASESTRERARNAGRWWFARSPVIYLGIDNNRFTRPGRERAAWGWRLLYVGRLDPRKGIETAIDALARLPEDATLACVGPGTSEERARILARARARGVADRVHLSLSPHSALAQRYADADAVVFPSLWEEPFGLVPVEAMACATPVVATGTGGSGEFLRDGANALVVPPGDAAALAKALYRLADEPDLRAQVIAGGLETAHELDIEPVTDAFDAWLTGASTGFANGEPAPRRLRLPGKPARPDPLRRHRTSVPAVVSGGDADAIKRLYVDLGEDWLTECTSVDAVPVLSAPETLPAVVKALEDTVGLVLDAGCGPKPALSVSLARRADRCVIALDIGWGTVNVAREAARSQGAAILGVVGDVERLPFRDRAFDAVACDDTIEHLPDDVAGVSELTRVLRSRGRGVLATPNRRNALVLRAKLRDWMRGARKPARAYYCAESHLREYTWREFEHLARSALRVRRRHGVGWERGWKSRVASTLVRVPPLRTFSQMVVLEVERP